jgi:hypothetical protein
MVQLTFRSGAQILVDVDEFTTGTSKVNGALRSLRWRTPADWTRKLDTVNLGEVVAVVAVRETWEVVDAANPPTDLAGHAGATGATGAP